MANRISRIVRAVVVGLAVLVVACTRVTVVSPDGTETTMSKSVYMGIEQQKTALALTEKFSGAFESCDADMTEIEAMSCNTAKIVSLLTMDRTMAAAQPQGYWQLQSAKWNFFGAVVSGPGTVLINRGFDALEGRKYDAGTNYYIGNRWAGGGTQAGGGAGPEGQGSSASGMADASGDNNFENMNIGNQNSLQSGDGTLLSGGESQFQTGDGTQGQAITRPITQPNITTDEGGNVNNESSGIGQGSTVGVQ